MSVYEDIATRLEAAGVATRGTTLFLGRMPDAPDTCLAVFQRGGNKSVRAFGAVNGAPIADRPMVQIQGRGATLPEITTLMQAAVVALDHYTGTLNGTRYLYVQLAYPPVDVGQDENGRSMMSALFQVMKERA